MRLMKELQKSIKIIWKILIVLPSRFKEEIFKISLILKHMLKAAKTSLSMNNLYVELGKITFQNLKKNSLEVSNEDPRLVIMKKIEDYHHQLDDLDKKVNVIKMKK